MFWIHVEMNIKRPWQYSMVQYPPIQSIYPSSKIFTYVSVLHTQIYYSKKHQTSRREGTSAQASRQLCWWIVWLAHAEWAMHIGTQTEAGWKSRLPPSVGSGDTCHFITCSLHRKGCREPGKHSGPLKREKHHLQGVNRPINGVGGWD